MLKKRKVFSKHKKLLSFLGFENRTCFRNIKIGAVCFHFYSKMDKRHISLKEAQEILPIIRTNMIKLMRINKALSLLKSVEIQCDDDYSTLMYNLRFNKKHHKLSYYFFKLLEELHMERCRVKDLENGIVDFYSIFEGREIFLCWDIRDTKIKYWHEATIGNEAKKPISMIRETLKLNKR